LGKLQSIYDEISDLEADLFGEGVLEENPWASENTEAMNAVYDTNERLKLSVAKAWTIIPEIQMLTASIPDDQARQMLIDNVGDYYYRQHFSFKETQYNTWDPNDWLTVIIYNYRVGVGNYSKAVEVSFIFDKMGAFIRSEGVPSRDTLMPFKVTREQAIGVGLTKVTGYVEVTAEIGGIRGSSERYCWNVCFYHSPRSSKQGSVTGVFVDLYTGEILSVETVSWTAS
jgi:hypothetical protein